MNPPKVDNSQNDLFQSRLSSQLNPKHEMVILSKMIDWDSIEKEFSSFYDGDNSKGGKPPKPVRLMTGLLLLQHLHEQILVYLHDEQRLLLPLHEVMFEFEQVHPVKNLM